MKNFSAATAFALALTAGSALAADLPSHKGPPVYVEPAPIFTWTGFYGGVNIGYGWSESQAVTGNVSFLGFPIAGWSYPARSVDGVLGGGQIGYNYQFGGAGFVVGLEADIQAADLTGSSNGAGASIAPGFFPLVYARQSIDWFGTVRGRLGYSILPTLLVYGTGGFAYGGGASRFSASDNFGVASAFASESDTRTGWTAGGGVEWAFLPNWSAKVEYLYIDLGHAKNLWSPVYLAGAPLPGVAAVNNGFNNRFHTVKVGLNYHFNLFSPGPVLAKY